MPIFGVGDFAGLRIVESLHAVTREQVPRSRRERWLSWPWRPWVKTKTVEKPAMYQMLDRVIAHPVLAQKLREGMRERNQRGY